MISLSFALLLLSVAALAQRLTALDNFDNNIMLEGERLYSTVDPSIALAFRRGGSIAIEVDGTSYESASLNPNRSPDTTLRLDNSGHVVVQDVDGITVWSSKGEDSFNFPFKLTVDVDRCARLRDVDGKILWTFPEPRGSLRNLVSTGMNYMRAEEWVASPNEWSYMYLDERGVLTSPVGGDQNEVPSSIRSDPRVLVLTKGGRLELRDLNGVLRWNSGREPGTSGAPYVFQISNSGAPEILNRNNDVVWSVETLPASDLRRFLSKVNSLRIEKGANPLSYDIRVLRVSKAQSDLNAANCELSSNYHQYGLDKFDVLEGLKQFNVAEFLLTGDPSGTVDTVFDVILGDSGLVDMFTNKDYNALGVAVTWNIECPEDAQFWTLDIGGPISIQSAGI